MLIVDERLVEIDELIDQLVGDFLKEDLVQAYLRARADLEADQELQKNIEFLAENIAHIPFRLDLRDMQKQVMLDPKVYAVKLAENDLQMLLSELTDQITSTISWQIPIDENLPWRGDDKHGHRKVGY